MYVKRAQEMFQADPRLIDWDSDNDELLDVHTTVQHVLTNKRSCVVTSVWLWSESKGPVWTAATLNVGFSGVPYLWNARGISCSIYKYRTVSSSGPHNMGWTDLVMHSIDTWEHHPIPLPPWRLPITKQDVEKAEVQKMLDWGVIELHQNKQLGQSSCSRHQERWLNEVLCVIPQSQRCHTQTCLLIAPNRWYTWCCCDRMPVLQYTGFVFWALAGNTAFVMQQGLFCCSACVTPPLP